MRLSTDETADQESMDGGVMDDVFVASLSDWRSLVYEFAYGHEEV